MENKKSSRVGFISPAPWNPQVHTGTLTWDDQKYRIKNVATNGDVNVADVCAKTDKTYLAPNGNEYAVYEPIGAIRFNRTTGTGEFVTDVGGMTAKYPLTTKVINGKDGKPVRILQFAEVSNNKYRTMFDEAATVISEEPEKVDVSGIPDNIPF